jgi:hypothetical protein
MSRFGASWLKRWRPGDGCEKSLRRPFTQRGQLQDCRAIRADLDLHGVARRGAAAAGSRFLTHRTALRELRRHLFVRCGIRLHQEPAAGEVSVTDPADKIDKPPNSNPRSSTIEPSRAESMGPITDHGFEHLAPSDQMITRTRRRLLIAARSLRDQGILPHDNHVGRRATAPQPRNTRNDLR